MVVINEPHPAASKNGVLERIRRTEIEVVRDLFPKTARILEVGGGNGFQAAILSSWGCNVVSIDVPRKERGDQYFPIEEYDGIRIPFEDSSFDIVFSSNVLEHIPDVTSYLKEIRRVSKPYAASVHILPSSTWRFWTCLSHYVYAARWLTGTQPRIPGVVEPVPVGEVLRQNGLTSVLKQVVLAGAHGEYPNAFSELYFYSRDRWRKVFQQVGFRILEIRDCGIFQTGYSIFPNLAIKKRQHLARWLGSSSFAIVAKISD